MMPRRRRWFDAVLLIVAALVTGALATVATYVGDPERITGLWAGAEISRNGSARIAEVIDYDFGSNSRHGIFRDVPGLDADADADVTVTSDSHPVPFELSDLGSQTRIQIGDSSRTISGRHRYRIQYPLKKVAPKGRLAWDAVGTGWPVKVSRVEAHVVAPFELTAPRCVQGAAGSQDACTTSEPGPGRLAVRIDKLDAHQGATLYAGAGRRIAAGPPPPPPTGPAAGGETGINPLLAGLLAGAVMLVAAALVALFLRRAGRDHVATGEPAEGDAPAYRRVDAGRLASSVTPASTPPEDLTPSEGALLLAEQVRPEHKVAWLINAAIDEYVDMEGDSHSPVLVRRTPPMADATAAVLNELFDGRDRVTLGSYDRDFTKAWGTLGRRLESWQRTCGLWDPFAGAAPPRAAPAGGRLSGG